MRASLSPQQLSLPLAVLAVFALSSVDSAILQSGYYFPSGIVLRPSELGGIPACSNDTEGMMYYNPSLKTMRLCDGTEWGPLIPVNQSQQAAATVLDSLSRAALKSSEYCHANGVYTSAGLPNGGMNHTCDCYDDPELGYYAGEWCDICASGWTVDTLGRCILSDQDSDGLADAEDNCPLIANVEQDDADSDGVGDACDICQFDYNPGQEDSDSDGFGDHCGPASANTTSARCANAVGIEDPQIIPDSSMSASTTWSENWLPREGRKNFDGAWGPNCYCAVGEYLQVDMLHQRWISRFGSQCHQTNYCINEYSLSFSLDGVTYVDYMENGVTKIFEGTHRTDPVGFEKVNVLEAPVLARYVRYNLQAYESWPAVRVEAYECL